MGVGVVGSQFEAFVIAVRDQYGLDSTVPDITTAAWQIGRLKGMGQAAAPSIKFSRPGGTVQPTTRPGPHAFDDGGTDKYFMSTYEEVSNVQVRILAKDWSQLECIWSGLLAATRDIIGSYSVPGIFDHISEGDDDPMPEFVKGNQLLMQNFAWTILIPHAIGTFTEITRILGTSQFHDINPAPGTAGPATDQT